MSTRRPSSIFAGRRYRLYLSREQQDKATKAAGCCRVLWNAALEQRLMAWRVLGQSVRGVEQMAELPELKRTPGFEWLAEDGIAQSLQQTLWDLDRAYARWLAREASRPRFKRKGQDNSFRLPQGRDLPVRALNRRWGEVRIPKLGWCRFRCSRAIDGEIRHATITRDALGWHVSFCVALAQRPPEAHVGDPVGVDLGVVATVALSTGEIRRCPGLPEGQAKRLRRLCRRAGRQETLRRSRPAGQRQRSARHQRTLDQIRQLKARDARIRKDFVHKVSTQLAKSHGLIAVESLHVASMTHSAKGTVAKPGTNVAQKAALNRAILAQAWGGIRRQLGYKTSWYGSQLIEVPSQHTSCTCAECGTVDARSRESQARFRCTNCGHTTHADINAARVILARAMAGQEDGGQIGPLQRGEPSRRTPGQRTANHPAGIAG